MLQGPSVSASSCATDGGDLYFVVSISYRDAVYCFTVVVRGPSLRVKAEKKVCV